MVRLSAGELTLTKDSSRPEKLVALQVNACVALSCAFYVSVYLQGRRPCQSSPRDPGVFW